MAEKEPISQTSPINGHVNGNGVINSKPKDHIEHSEKTPSQWIMGDAFTARAKHHASIKALWETKWKFPCEKGVYPFHDGKFGDFERVFNYLIENDINDGYGDAYTKAFFPVCDDLLKEAESCAASGKSDQASDIYLRVACLYRISRFPIMNSPVKWKAWEAQKETYMKAAETWTEPIREESIPHKAACGADGPTIPIYYRVPRSATEETPCPTMLLITGLDGHRPDNTQRTSEFLQRGWGCVIVEIPGTADCPADPKDATSPDRLWDSVFDWMTDKKIFSMPHVLVWGLSCGGYYAVRIAHTHRKWLKGVVAHGAGVHHCFSREWLDEADGHEYPFKLCPALAQKFGYDNVEDFKENSQKTFSLLETGILEKESTRLLLVNGTHDGLMPIEDSMLLFNYSSPKEAR
ncbi:Alpha/beta hydrolase fold-5 [Lasallia pustulata]|uniref:Alpha/beta hydrolase fold-5 n=1 Tax=Lasallia pustulata TaxID=136370 RepID=A0A1W5D973_9LECA|nr:Alpha/beta hydrolase fold-5 [Lasallia pustulata]